MRFGHATALALVGWYLMMPPMAADRDSSCESQNATFAASDLFWALLAWRSPREVNMFRCDNLRHEVLYDAPVSDWRQVGSFETLVACQAEYEKNQKPLKNEDAMSQNIAHMEFVDEGESRPSEEQIQTRGNAIELSVIGQSAGEKCIATDDPRLKEK
jgi:hypothetical protein